MPMVALARKHEVREHPAVALGRAWGLAVAEGEDPDDVTRSRNRFQSELNTLHDIGPRGASSRVHAWAWAVARGEIGPFEDIPTVTED
jgi:hypothetical protein